MPKSKRDIEDKPEGRLGFTKKMANIAPSRVAEYIRAIYIDGEKKYDAFERYIDPLARKVDYKNVTQYYRALEKRPDWAELKDMILKEDEEYMLRRSGTLQRKAMNVLMNTIAAAEKAVADPANCSRDDLKIANEVLKNIMPAMTAITSDITKRQFTATEKRDMLNGGNDSKRAILQALTEDE
jgi:hypothetical protein